ncbi:ester cyclase [Caulifigura coniformis]|nr:ester cyclase [Caulifigura coniformis]
MGESAVLARRWFEEVWNDRREATIDELTTANSVCHADQGELRGPECFRLQQYAPFVGAFPNLRVTVEDVMESGPQAVVRWSARGTHLGADLGFPPTGRAVDMRGITWMRFENGVLVEGWQSSNLPDVIRSLKG